MYTSFQIAKKYLYYLVTASSGKGHGIHSPFVFDFISKILRDRKQYDCYAKIEAIRKSLLYDPTIINVVDFGAGSSVIKSNKRAIKDIAGSSLKPKKYARLLFRMVQFYKPASILELGTSFGISTAYMASGNMNALVKTCEGAEEIASIAQNNFEQLGLPHIKMVVGDFKQTIIPLLDNTARIDLVFLDGNHRKAATLEYFYTLLKYASLNTIMVFDDIHWSSEMEEAWEIIKNHPAVTISIDLFFLGIIFFNIDIKVPQQFCIRF